MGTSPERLAWSLAVGAMIGINPILGSTTLLCLALAFLFRLNVAASQIANHLVYPFELLLVIPFIHLGSRLFQTAPIPLSPSELLHAAKTHPMALTREIWMWEWHALVAWLCVVVLATPLLALVLTSFLRRLRVRIQRHEYPVLAAVHSDSTPVA